MLMRSVFSPSIDEMNPSLLSSEFPSFGNSTKTRVPSLTPRVCSISLKSSSILELKIDDIKVYRLSIERKVIKSSRTLRLQSQLIKNVTHSLTDDFKKSQYKNDEYEHPSHHEPYNWVAMKVIPLALSLVALSL